MARMPHTSSNLNSKSGHAVGLQSREGEHMPQRQPGQTELCALGHPHSEVQRQATARLSYVGSKWPSPCSVEKLLPIEPTWWATSKAHLHMSNSATLSKKFLYAKKRVTPVDPSGTRLFTPLCHCLRKLLLGEALGTHAM
eukprot:775348-Amphidinium_carterae.1